MTSVEDLARTIRDAANAGLRVAQGTVVAVVDTTHVSVDLGDRVITAYRPGSVPAGEGAGVRVLVGAGVAEVVSSSGGAVWTTPTFTNSWANFAAGVASTAYRKVGDRVELRGAIKSDTSATPAFTLPAGYRPADIEIFYVVAGPGGARLDVNAAGEVIVRDYRSAGTNAMVTLSGVYFAAA